jgi:hypothetical protein
MSNDTQPAGADDDPLQREVPGAPASALDPQRPHHQVHERERARHDGRSLPPNPQADTAYGPVRGADPANPESSARDDQATSGT